jgi:hypothetical protein
MKINFLLLGWLAMAGAVAACRAWPLRDGGCAPTRHGSGTVPAVMRDDMKDGKWVQRRGANSPRTVSGASLPVMASAGALAVRGLDGGRVALSLRGAVVARFDIEA